MHVILLLAGLVSLIAGAGMLAFGFLNSAFGLGNTLIMAGVTAAAGGVLMVGLGSVVSRLRRIAELLERQPLPHALDDRPPLRSLGLPPLRPPHVAPSAPTGADAPSNDGAGSVKPAPVVGVEVAEPRGGAAGAKLAGDLPPPAPAPAVPPAPEPAAVSVLDAEWPRVTAADRVVVPPVPDVDVAPDSQPQAEPPPEPVAITILKSGVIEGMAYTLYSDGSIEAELPQGTLRFGSIAELRTHLRGG